MWAAVNRFSIEIIAFQKKNNQKIKSQIMRTAILRVEFYQLYMLPSFFPSIFSPYPFRSSRERWLRCQLNCWVSDGVSQFNSTLSPELTWRSPGSMAASLWKGTHKTVLSLWLLEVNLCCWVWRIVKLLRAALTGVFSLLLCSVVGSLDDQRWLLLIILKTLFGQNVNIAVFPWVVPQSALLWWAMRVCSKTEAEQCVKVVWG